MFEIQFETNGEKSTGQRAKKEVSDNLGLVDFAIYRASDFPISYISIYYL